jgi:predicted amidohydrolase YtcJ
MDPLAGIHAAVTRQRQDGSPLDGWYPGERVTVEDALTAYSAGAARATGEDQALGCIAPGFAADCVVLSHDIVHEPESLLEAKVEMTMVGGNVVYARPGSGFEACLPGKD